ncbi:hypothetical protein [Botrimarina sp.]|uniref:hypothetical protein n=1 Tax=Botrimarina sp. TaxID=2795802 RepID=UPI0032EF87A6
MSDQPPAAPQRKRRPWVWLVLGVLALVLLGPMLLSLTPWPGELISGALPASAGRLTVRSTSLGWTGPLSLAGVTLRTPDGAEAVAVERVALQGGLLGLLAGDSAPLVVSVEQPRVNLVVSPQGTNLDSLFDEARRRSEQADDQPDAPASRRPLSIAVSDAAVGVTDTSTGERWLLSGANLRVEDPGRGLNSIEATIEAALSRLVAEGAAEPPAGRIAARIGAAEGGGRLAYVEAESLPLSLVAPLVRRVDPTADLAGWASIQGQTAWSDEGIDTFDSLAPADVLATLLAGGVRSSGTARLASVDYRGAATEGQTVRFGQVEAPWRLAAAGDRLAVERLDLVTPVGEVRIAGSLTPAEARAWGEGTPLAPRDLRFTGGIDFDRLAEIAPRLVRLQDDARIESGRVDATLTCDAGRVRARLVSSPLTGRAGGEPVQWRDPIDLRIDALQHDATAGLAGWVLESLAADATFFSAAAQGDAQRLRGRLDFDLDKLAEQLAPIVDLGGTRLAGAGEARFDAKRTAATGRWRVSADGEVNNLLVGEPDAPLAREPKLAFTAEVDGAVLDETTPTGTVQLTAGDDRLVIDLPRPDGAAAGPQPLRIELAGDAARWFRRVAIAGELPPPERLGLVGAIELTIAGRRDAQRIEIDRANLALTGLSLDTAGLGADATRVVLRDERIEASGRGAYDAQRRVAQVDEAQVATSVASARAREVSVEAGAPEALRGEAVYRLDLERLSAWLPAAAGPSRYVASGLVDGKVTARGVPEGLNLRLSARGNRLTLRDRQAAAAADQVLWSEPALSVVGDAMVASRVDASGASRVAVEFRDMRVESETLNGSFGGRIADAATLRGVEVGGGVDYDLEKLTPVLWPRLGDGVRLVGRDRATFRLESDDTAPPDAPAVRRLAGRFEAPWQGANLFGLPVGPGRLAATLRGGVLRTDPLDVSLGEGRLTATATARLDPPPAVVSLAPGPLVSDVAMSAEVNGRVLKYIAPVLADAAQIDGRYSIALSELVAPVDDELLRQQGRAAGVLDIHRLRVTPGPAVAEWVALVRQIQGVARDGVESVVQPRQSVLVAIDNNRTEFQLQNGRVYHRGLAFFVGDAIVQSSGSVGLDESLNLVLAVPILDEWVDRRPQYLGRLRGQAIRIPIQGTFSRPKINSDAFRELSRGLVESAAAGAIEGGLNLLFEKLRER